jgi:hypothetical protein
VLFTVVSQQPLSVQPPYDRTSDPLGDVPDYHLLDPQVVQPLRPLPRPGYLAAWDSSFDYLLVLKAGGMNEFRNTSPAGWNR